MGHNLKDRRGSSRSRSLKERMAAFKRGRGKRVLGSRRKNGGIRGDNHTESWGKVKIDILLISGQLMNEFLFVCALSITIPHRLPRP